MPSSSASGRTTMAFPRPPSKLPLSSNSLPPAPSSHATDLTNTRASPRQHGMPARQVSAHMSRRHFQHVQGDADVSSDEDDDSLLFGSSDGSDNDDSDSDAFMTARTLSTTLSRSNTELLECLGRDAVTLLARLDCERASSPSPARRVTGAISVTQSAESWAPAQQASDVDDWSSINSASSQSLFHLAPRKRFLLHGTRALAVTTDDLFTSTDDNVARSTSFTRTDIADLDIEGILESYGPPVSPKRPATRTTRDEPAPFSFGASASLLPAPASKSEPRTPRANRASPSPRARASPRTRAGPAVKRQIVFPTTASVTPNSPKHVRVVRRQQSVADLPYNDLFSSHSRVSPFPTRKKSTSTLHDRTANQAQRLPPVPPMPFGYASSPTSSPEILRTVQSSHTRARQTANLSDSSSSRLSYQSSAPSSSGHDSFRWSTTSGSTAPTISEDSEWDSSRRGSLADSTASSSQGCSSSDVLLSRQASVSTKARSIRSNGSTKSKTSVAAARRARARRDTGELIDWTTFADELVHAERGGDAASASKTARVAANDDDAEECLGSRHVMQTMAEDDPETMLEMLALGSSSGGQRQLNGKASSKSLRNRTIVAPASMTPVQGPFPTTARAVPSRATSIKSTKSSSSSSAMHSLLSPPTVVQKKKSLLSLRSLRSNSTLRASAQQQHSIPPVPSLPNSRKAPDMSDVFVRAT
ncbi:hypothetical protein ACM66B_000196 [Microbotryomycetes sp. NB124-2]